MTDRAAKRPFTPAAPLDRTICTTCSDVLEELVVIEVDDAGGAICIDVHGRRVAVALDFIAAEGVSAGDLLLVQAGVALEHRARSAS